MIINTTYFKGPFAIAQLGQPAVLSVVNTYITDGEADLLPKALGMSLYEALLEGLDVSSGEDVDERWAKLLEGEFYTDYAGNRRQFVGLENILPNFVWYNYQKDMIKQAAGIGTVQPNAENAMVTAPDLPRAWNAMIKNVAVLWNYLYSKLTIYPEYKPVEVDGAFFGHGTALGTINQFGI